MVRPYYSSRCGCETRRNQGENELETSLLANFQSAEVPMQAAGGKNAIMSFLPSNELYKLHHYPARQDTTICAIMQLLWGQPTNLSLFLSEACTTEGIPCLML